MKHKSFAWLEILELVTKRPKWALKPDKMSQNKKVHGKTKQYKVNLLDITFFYQLSSLK